ncbi:MAG: nitroreductase family protein [Candidatus Bathyarchaeia archaeon]
MSYEKSLTAVSHDWFIALLGMLYVSGDGQMDVHEALRIRRSVRAYEERPVPKEALDRILEAGRLAPSARNRQPWHFIVVTDAEKRKVIAKAPFAKFVAEAPVVIVGLGDAKASPRWYMVDVAIALENMVIAATAEGLGTCWIGGFIEDELRKLLEIPEDLKIVALVSVGYPRMGISSEIPPSRPKRSLQEVASLDKFGQPYK